MIKNIGGTLAFPATTVDTIEPTGHSSVNGMSLKAALRAVVLSTT